MSRRNLLTRLAIVDARIVLLTTLLVGCGDGRPPTAPTSSPRASASPGPAAMNDANWAADAVVVATTGGFTCGWGTSPGETRSGVLWRITQDIDTITLDEDVPNWPTDDVPFHGRLTATHFDATVVETAGGLCAFRGGELTGTFSDDGLTFEAIEMLHWGSAEHVTTVQRRWNGRRLTTPLTSSGVGSRSSHGPKEMGTHPDLVMS